jgi:iron(III) transport system substrate-binding protein
MFAVRPGWAMACAALAIIAVGAFLAARGTALAQANRFEQIESYAGPARQQQLTEAAKREGEITLYSALTTDDNAALIEGFEHKYGLKVRLWRASSEMLLRRVINEAGARRFEFDAILSSASGLEPLHRERLLQEIKSPILADLIPQAMRPHREWVAMFINSIVQAYNTRLVKKERLPQSYRDLLRPEWKGKLGIEAEDHDWFASVVTELGETDGLKLFGDIVATNGMSVRTGHSLLTNLVAAGEVPLALTVYGYLPEQLKAKGAPIDWFVIPPAMARPTGVAVARSAPHPNAAVLFFEYILGDAQPTLAARNFVTVSKTIESPFTRMPLKVIDSGLMLNESDRWQALYRRTLLGQVR